jgi:hypothetical protein
MITKLGGFAGDVVAVACSGHVTRSDYETVLIPTVEAALKAHPKLRLYYQVGADFAGIEPGAMWEDFSLGMEHLSRWERVAVVTDVAWMRLAIQTFAFLMPGKARVFPLTDAAQAKAWVSER